MALIACRACGHQISEQAPACPFCGHPAAAQLHDGAPVTTQLTGKSLKLSIIISSILFWAGALTLIVTQGQEGGILAAVGATWYVLTRFAIWWNHG